MTTIACGSNRFVDCPVIIGIRGRPLLSIVANPPRVSLTTPAELRSGRSVQVRDNQSEAPDGNVRVVATDKSVAIFWGEDALVIATLLEPETIVLKIDLRPVGMNLFEDAAGLHIGGNTIVGNLFEGNAPAVELG